MSACWIYLASQSPRRRQLLEQWGVHCELLLPNAEEDAEALEHWDGQEPPASYVQRVTRLKLDAAVQRRLQRNWVDGPILCADTTVALGEQILGKPDDADHARLMLRQLSGQKHKVLTAVAVAHRGRVWRALSRSEVTFGDLSDHDIDRYVATGEPMGKAGAYAIQGLAGMFIRHIGGSYTGIMGLPAYETAKVLRDAGLELL